MKRKKARPGTIRANKERLRAWRAALEKTLRELKLLRTLEDMTEEEIQAIEQQYGMPVKRPGSGK